MDLDLPAGAEKHKGHLMVLDDQLAIRTMMQEVLAANHYRVSLARDLREASHLIRTESFDAIFVDIFLNENETGLQLLPDISQLQPTTPTIVISGMANMDHVMEALKAGAYDMLCKPFNLVDLLNVVGRALDKKRMADENVRLVEALRKERDLLEERVDEATRDLHETIGTVRLVNEQVSAMFEISQTPLAEGTTQGMIGRIFELLRRIMDFEGAFCVIYDIRAREINLASTDGRVPGPIYDQVVETIRRDGNELVDRATRMETPTTANLHQLLSEALPFDTADSGLLLMPIYVHQSLLGVVGLQSDPDRATDHVTPAEERMLGLAISQMLAALEQRSYIARTAQLASLGELIAEIAHDLRHPMTAMRGASQILLAHPDDLNRRERCLGEIQGNLGRMESLVSELVNFYNPREMNMVAVDLHALLDKALEVTAAILDTAKIEIVRHYDHDQPMILGLTKNLIEAFINLISNAAQAMEPGGRLTVSTRLTLDDEDTQRLRIEGFQPTGYLRVAVADTGCGVAEEDRERIFKRFFTTKPEGHGLGLSAVLRLVRKNLGHIRLETEQGKGSTFYVYLPKA